jgi:1-acyl-sn-glycerol-3-phosphate acyltransferase
MAELTHDEAHRIAREKGTNRWVFLLFRIICIPIMRLFWGLRITGAENVPRSGRTIVAPNHKSFYDSFFIAAATPRHIRFMGKSELFRGRHGRLLLALGAFPVQRGQSDAVALETSRIILEQDGLLALFPEGTRVRGTDQFGTPKRGAARLALETHSPLIPAAISGTEKMFWHGIPRPIRVQVAFGAPIPVHDLEATQEAAGAVLNDELWPQVQEEYRKLRARPGLIAAGLAAAGIGVALSRRRKAP